MRTKAIAVPNVITYYGVNIWRNTDPGYKLRYTARLPIGDQVAANTLAGIKQLIRASRTQRIPATHH